MAVFAGGKRSSEGRASWPAIALTLAVFTSSSFSAFSLYQLMALRAEVEGLKSDVCRRRHEGQEAEHEGQTDTVRGGRSEEAFYQPPSDHDVTLIRTIRMVTGEEKVSQPCLQLLANSSRKTFSKGIPWQVGLRRGSSLEAGRDSILVKEEGYYFVYSQVYYMDTTFAMGHVVIRKKRNVVGDEPQYVTLFRCIQNMNRLHPYNTCYTGGIVKLEVDDLLELLIPRSTANVSLDGDATFLGAVKLA
ncbi:tumor necrosis factor ligand superfamily member 13B isoform X2 [Betta splendens]|uniref:Tumor necrosis factor ligand superfamily member 13B isoform X2 n=1 Tax=Betta splendens TaxID=158456 RepID=A0A6P7LHE2_BETSP|nr:tumor necrosis factor ligand superfamily member 13B isoform X2 [Betta splendens]